MPKNTIPTKVITGPKTRFSYLCVNEPKAPLGGGTPKYSVSLIIPKSDAVTVAKINAAIRAAYEEGQGKLKGSGKSVPPLSSLKTPLRDGDAERPDDAAYADSWFVNAKTRRSPAWWTLTASPSSTQANSIPGSTAGRASISTRSTSTETAGSHAG